MKALNASKSTIIASNMKEARGFFSRLKGLLGKPILGDGEGLWMARCRAIHTFGMRFPIDVVFLDRDFIVKMAVKSVLPCRTVISCLSAKSVIELPEGTIVRAQLQIGDKIEIVRNSISEYEP